MTFWRWLARPFLQKNPVSTCCLLGHQYFTKTSLRFLPRKKGGRLVIPTLRNLETPLSGSDSDIYSSNSKYYKFVIPQEGTWWCIFFYCIGWYDFLTQRVSHDHYVTKIGKYFSLLCRKFRIISVLRAYTDTLNESTIETWLCALIFSVSVLAHEITRQLRSKIFKKWSEKDYAFPYIDRFWVDNSGLSSC